MSTSVSCGVVEPLGHCFGCDRDVPVSSFARDASKKRGRKSLCLECDREKSKRYYAANRDRVLARVTAYNETHRPTLAPKMCARCGVAELANRRRVYCDGCRPARLKARNWRPNRDHYGAVHQRIRKMWARVVAMGTVDCARCGLRIRPGQKWDLGHVDGDKTRYAGPEHRFGKDCPKGGNRATSRRDRQKPVCEW